MAKVAKKGFPKPLIIIIIVVIVLLGAGYFLMNNPMVKKGLDAGTGGQFSSIKDALTKSVSLECEYKDPTSGENMKVWIKNGAIRSDMPAQGGQEAGTMIMKDKKMYIWSNKEGMVMSLETPEGTEGQTMDNENEAENLIKDLEAYKNDCKPSVVSDSLFTPPTDVEFTDLSEMMKSGKGYYEGEAPSMDQYTDDETTVDSDY